MTTTSNGNTTGSESAQSPVPNFTTTVDWHGVPDATLQDLSTIALHLGSGLGVTLFLPWGMVAGTTISSEAFYRTSAEHLRQETVGTDSEAMMEKFVSDFIDPTVERLHASVGDVASSMHQTYRVARHIHLMDAQAVIGNRLVYLDRLRIQLNHVSAWTYGQTRFTD